MKAELDFKPYEPLRKNRFLINFKGAFNKLKSITLKETSRPYFKNGKWEDITISLNDIIGDLSPTKSIMEGVHYYINNKNSNKFNLHYDLDLLDPVGIVVERWNISGIILEIDFGELNYNNDELCTVKIVLQPTKVILNF